MSSSGSQYYFNMLLNLEPHAARGPATPLGGRLAAALLPERLEPAHRASGTSATILSPAGAIQNWLYLGRSFRVQLTVYIRAQSPTQREHESHEITPWRLAGTGNIAERITEGGPGVASEGDRLKAQLGPWALPKRH